MAKISHRTQQKRIMDAFKNSKKIILKTKMCSYIANSLMHYHAPDFHLFYKIAVTSSISLK
jgi:hypothetical protein